MSRRSESGRGLPVALAGLVLAPACAFAGVTLGSGAPLPARPTPQGGATTLPQGGATTVPQGGAATAGQGGATAVPQAAAGTVAHGAGAYQIRCWQHGKLLFEDRVNLPADAAAYGIRLSGTDRWGRPLYVADTRNATCLVRTASDGNLWPPR